jgi:PAT family beta-lactamase induction signal transducer AmpG
MASQSPSAERSLSQGRGPWWWVPSLYFAEGIPYVVVMTVAVIMFKRLGVGNKEIALYTSWLYLPYAIKPLWSPLVQRFGTRRGWVIVMQLLIAAGLACTALSIPLESFLRWSLVALAVVAVSSATHDVAADGFYLLALSSHQQAWFVGIRSTAYRMAMIAGQGLLVMLAGVLESSTGLPTLNIEVRAVAGEPAPGSSAPFSSERFEFAGEAEPQRVVSDSETYELSLSDKPAWEVQALVDAVRDWNSQHGFYEKALGPAAEGAASPPAGERAAWLVTLENWIRDRFGPAKPPPSQSIDRSGDATAVLLQLTQPVPAGEHQVVQFGRSGGDASFQVVEGERFVVTDRNWNQFFAAVVQRDAKLDRPSEATFQVRSGDLPLAWSVTFFIAGGMFLAFGLYHAVAMPRPAADQRAGAATNGDWLTGFVVPFVTFFRKPRIIAVLAFLLLYRFPEAQLVKLATPFLLDTKDDGGLALTTGEVGFVYGTVGVVMLTLGGLIGGFVAARNGLKFWLWPMALTIHLPNFAFLFLAYAQPESLWIVTAAVGVEQFGYGFGFTAYLLYCVYVARGQHETVHYALCTGFMALGMMIPGMWSGWLEELIGYRHFFVWIMLAMIPSLLAICFIPLDAEFGKKTADEQRE